MVYWVLKEERVTIFFLPFWLIGLLGVEGCVLNCFGFQKQKQLQLEGLSTELLAACLFKTANLVSLLDWFSVSLLILLKSMDKSSIHVLMCYFAGYEVPNAQLRFLIFLFFIF